MARARGDHSAADGREIRQQRLPLSWREEPAATPARAEGEGAAPEETPVSSAPVAATASPAPAPASSAAVASTPSAAAAVPGQAAQTEPASAAPEPPAAAAEPPAAPAEASAPAPELPAASAAPAVGESSRPETEPAPASASAPEAPGAALQVAETSTAAAAPEGGVGDLLLAARADSGFSVEETSARTRIPRDVIEHLECSAYHALPSEYYCRAHIEKLCALYNVDAAAVLSRLHDDMVAQRGEAEGLGHFRAVTTDSESGSKISYVLPGPGATGKPRSVSVTGAVVSGVIGVFLLVALVALAALHFRNRDGKPPAANGSSAPVQVGHQPPVGLKEFIVPEQLNAYELPIPDK